METPLDNGHFEMHPYVAIIEQPARSAVRFRYKCEGRSAGPIPGASSSSYSASHPTIKIFNYTGRAMVMVSCVTASPPFKQHPHHIIGRIGCYDGICTMIIDNSDLICSFSHLGIQCAKRNEIIGRLKQRKMMGIDPTNAGFEHILKSSKYIDLTAIRLCFHVILEEPKSGKFCLPIDPVISDPIYDKKLLSKVTIIDMSTQSALLSGGKVMIFCNYIDEDDIEVRFFQTDSNGKEIWNSIPCLKPPYAEIHKRVAMTFHAPPYHNPHAKHVVKVWLQLRRPSDGESSVPIPFYYFPKCHSNCPSLYHFMSFYNFDSIDVNSEEKIACNVKGNEIDLNKWKIVAEKHDDDSDDSGGPKHLYSSCP